MPNPLHRGDRKHCLISVFMLASWGHMTITKVSSPRGLDAVYYMVKDLARARKFYEDGLGFKATFVNDSGEWQGVEYELPTGQTFGLGKSNSTPWRECGGAMIAVDNVEEHTNRVTEFGGKIHMGPTESPVCVISWCEDTEGNTFALHHRKDGTVG
jgi:predicted enzyme related to lactoylglutathione lyase